MRAGVFVGVDQPLSLEDLTPWPPGPSDVVVRIDASGVCHTDAAVLHGHLPWDAPSILGHEVAGTVVEIGSGVDRVHVGDRVISSGLPACGNCFACVRGQSHLCEFTFQISATPRARRGDGTSVPAFASLGGLAHVTNPPQGSIVATCTAPTAAP